MWKKFLLTIMLRKKHDNAFWQTTTMRWASAKHILFFTSATTPGVVFIAFNFGSVKYPR